jgi:diaminopimelate epimerase
MTPTAGSRLHLTKHHGAGNDFLVVLDRDGTSPLDPRLVAALCDRHRGVGADGVIRVLAGGSAGVDGAELAMELRNADGGVAETSGNGLRCLAQAAVEAGWVPPASFGVLTAAGLRTVDYEPGGAGTAFAWVGMGHPEIGPEEELGPGTGLAVGDVKVARWVDVGNPHLVLVGADPDRTDVGAVGMAFENRRPGGCNVEFVSVDPDGLRIRVWERGVGETRACGTGSVAAATVTRAAGLSGDRVSVRNPGGRLEVVFTGDEARLGGPVHKVADIEVDRSALLAATHP